MRLIDIFEARFQEIVHENPSVATLKALARNNKYHSARFVITKSGDVYAADSEHFTHHSLAPFDGAWEVRGYVQYMGDGEYAYRSMAPYSALNKDHVILRTWERGGIQNGNPDQSHLSEHVVQDVLVPRPQIDLFRHTDLTLDDQVQVEKLQDDVDGLVIYKSNQVAAYLLVQHYQGHAWMLEAHTAPQYRRQGLNALLMDSAVKKYGRVFAHMDLTPHSVMALESYVSRTPYKVYRFDTVSGDLWDYNPANPDDQMTPMYNRWTPGVKRPPHSQAGKFVWAFSTEKPRHPLLQGYMRNLGDVQPPSTTMTEAWSAKYKRSINCDHPKGFSQRAHCAGRKRRASHKARSHAVSESAPHSTHNMIDNQKGWGAVPDNQNVDYLGMRVLMGAGTFLRLVAPLSRQAATSVDDIRRHLEGGHTVGSPWLTIRIPPAWEDGDFSEPARVISHEGRNRMWAIQELVGNQGVEVHVFFAGGLRARHIQPEWINQINQQLIPQGGTQPIEGAFFDTLIKEGAPGTLKAKITRTYGGSVTCDKARRLKSRSGATTHDKRQANWFLNMNCGGARRLDEIFTEPAQHVKWNRGQHGNYEFFETEFVFRGNRVVVGLYEDHDQTSARFVTRNNELQLPSYYKGYSVVFKVNGSTDATGEVGTAASKLFAQVVAVLKGFLSTHSWDYVLFVGDPGSRDRLYDALAHLVAKQVGAQVATHRSDFLIYKPFTELTEAGGVGLVVPGVNMPTCIHPDEIRRQARKWGFKVTAQGVPPTARTDGKLTEGKQTPCIVVDVQPEYSGVNDGDENPVFEHIIQFVNQQTGPVLMFVNAEDQGLTGDTVQDVKSYWEDSGFDPDNWHRVTIVDKGYGYLRSWMDQGIPARAMIKTIRTMYAQKVSDSRELFGGEDSDSYEPGFKQLLGPDYDPIMLDDPIYVNWISVAQLKRFEGSFMMGGGRHECLREVELIMNAFNIHFKRVNNLVYG